MRARAVAGLSILCGLVFGYARPSSARELADETDDPSVENGIDGPAPSGTPVISIRKPSRPARPGSSGGSGPGITTGAGYGCTWYRLDGADQPDFNQPYDPAARRHPGLAALLGARGHRRHPHPPERGHGGGHRSGAPAPTGTRGASQPQGRHRPAGGGSTWLWVTNFESLSVTAAVPGTTADLVATPASVSFDMGDGRAPLVMGVGAQFACQAPGTPYDVSLRRRASAARAPTPTSAPRLVVPPRSSPSPPTMSYSLAWAADTGRGGRLPTLTRSTTFGLRVAEAQALVTG